MSIRTRTIATAVCGVLILAAPSGCGIDGQPDSSSASSRSAADEDQASPTDGESAAEIEMPEVIGKNAAVAEDELEKLGFTQIQLGSVDPEHDTIGVVNPANWTVEEQSHEKGEKVAADATIVLGCVKNS